MATFRKRGSNRWQAQVRRKGYPDQTKTFSTRAAAAQWVRSIEYEMDQGLFMSRNEAETTCASHLFVWLDCIAFFRSVRVAFEVCSSGWGSSLERLDRRYGLNQHSR